MKKISLLLSITLIMLQANSIDIKGNAGWEYQNFLDKPSNKRDEILELNAKIETTYKKNSIKVKLSAEALKDIRDDQRSNIWLNEAYVNYSFDDSVLRVGKEIKFWGALEAYNLSDIFNPQNLLKDPFETNKLGIQNISYTYFFENSELSIIAKLKEEDQKISQTDYPYYPLPENLPYNHHLKTEKSKHRPTYYLKYSGSTDTTYPLDFALIYQNGYDNQRDIIFNGITLNQYAYIIDKYITYNTLLLESTLYKLEAQYTDVKEHEETDNYWQYGIGFEHTLYQIYNQIDLGLIVEYYKSDKQNILFQNDLFLGTRINFNDTDSTEILAGVVIDREYHEELYKLEFERRLYDSLKLKMDFMRILPSKQEKTVLSKIGGHTRVKVKLGYYF